MALVVPAGDIHASLVSEESVQQQHRGGRIAHCCIEVTSLSTYDRHILFSIYYIILYVISYVMLEI